MKVRILGVQPGTVTVGMSNEEYFHRQLELVRERFDGEELVVFPELMTGIYFGYVREKRWFQCAEDFLTGPTTQTMLALCRELKTNICYSLFEKDGSDYYNTLGLVSPIRGVYGKYRKIHIPGGDLRYNECYENYYFKSGNIMPVYDLDNGVKVAMLTCYDRSFPEQWRAYFLKGAEIICVPACTMGLRKDMFVTELQTRALESHSYVIALNRAGEEKTEAEVTPRVHFGRSLVIDPLGNIVAALDDEPWTTISTEIDTDNNRYARARLNWERDRHPELYGIVSDIHYGRQGVIYEEGF